MRMDVRMNWDEFNREIRADFPALQRVIDGHPRTSTVSFTVGDYDAELVSRYLDSRGLMVWAGDFFASRLIERLGVAGRGGLVRIGIAPYNSRAELTRVIESLRDDAALAEFARQG